MNYKKREEKIREEKRLRETYRNVEWIVREKKTTNKVKSSRKVELIIKRKNWRKTICRIDCKRVN